MHLTMWLDVITIATGIPIILVIANNRTDHAPSDTTHGGTCARSNARNDRTRDRAGSGAYDPSSSAAGNDMISVGVANTTPRARLLTATTEISRRFISSSSRAAQVPRPGFRMLAPAMTTLGPS
jgi:hypothetical protein